MERFKNLDGITDIIVLVKLKNKYSWFCSEKTLWIMDYEKYSHSFDKNDNNFSERFDIGVLNETTVGLFMEHMKPYSASVEELRNLFSDSLPLRSFDEAYHLFPKLFIDFDEKKLYSVYSEQLMLEQYVPIEWNGAYEEFYSSIPFDERYWIVGNVDYEKELIN